MPLPLFRHPATRRDFLRAGLYALGVSAGLPPLFAQLGRAEGNRALAGQPAAASERILVVVELTGGNDGLNLVAPYADDAYHRARPRLGLRETKVLKLDDHFGLHPACTGLRDLFHEGRLAIVHGCGYPEPNLSHFTAMEWWHTANPHGNEPYGWLGRFADARWSPPREHALVNLGARQSRAVTAEHHSPLVFTDPRKLGRNGTPAQQAVLATFGEPTPTANPGLAFVNDVARSAQRGGELVRHACAEYHSTVDYGSGNNLCLDLKKVAALIRADLPTRIYYVSLGGFDTHAGQADIQNLLLVYLSDALRGFLTDLDQMGRGQDVAVMVFTEFGRRVHENASRGTDHGTATPMLVLGGGIQGGFHGRPPSLTDLDNGNLRMTTDFRSVYATLLQKWMAHPDTQTILRGNFPTLPLVA